MSGEAAWYVEIFYSVTFTFSTSIGMGIRLVDEKLQFFKNGSFININFIFIYIYLFFYDRHGVRYILLCDFLLVQ